MEVLARNSGADIETEVATALQLRLSLPRGFRDGLREMRHSVMPYYHGTHRSRLASIFQLGLRAVAEQNFPTCEPGVYLAGNPALSVMFMVEAYTGQKDSHEAPRDFLESIAVIVIDDAVVDKQFLEPDPNVEDGWLCWLYRKNIDVTNAPILSVDEIMEARESNFRRSSARLKHQPESKKRATAISV